MTHLPVELIESHTGPLRQLALQLVRDPHEADDAVQETWLQLYWMHAAVPSRVDLQGLDLLRLPPGEYRGILGATRVDFQILSGRNLLPKALLRR